MHIEPENDKEKKIWCDERRDKSNFVNIERVDLLVIK